MSRRLARRPFGYQREVPIRHQFEEDGLPAGYQRAHRWAAHAGWRADRRGAEIHLSAAGRGWPATIPCTSRNSASTIISTAACRPGIRHCAGADLSSPADAGRTFLPHGMDGGRVARVFRDAGARADPQGAGARPTGARCATRVSARCTSPSPRRAPGQVDLLDAVSEAVIAHHDLLVEAATGIGKTMGVLYPGHPSPGG